MFTFMCISIFVKTQKSYITIQLLQVQGSCIYSLKYFNIVDSKGEILEHIPRIQDDTNLLGF